MKKTVPFVVALLMLSSLCLGQSRTFSNTLGLRLKGAGAIQQNQEVSGYYYFYSLGKASKGKRTFILSILDENLQDVNTITLNEGKRTELLQGLYNGQHIIIKLYDRSTAKLHYLYFNSKGELLEREDVGYTLGTLEEVNNQAFVDYLAGDAYGYWREFVLRHLPSGGVDTGDNSQWVKTFKPSPKNRVVFPAYLCTAGDVLVSLLSNRKTRTGKKVHFEIQGVNLKTGEEVFRKPIQDNYTNQPIKAYYDEEKKTIHLLGLFYGPDTKVLNDNGLGLFNHTLSLEGELIDQKNLFWTKDFRDFMSIDNKGMAQSEERKGFLYFHEIVKHEDGSIVAIAEQYRRVASAAGIASNVLSAALGGGASASYTKIQVYDMAIFHFNEDFSVRDVKFIHKSKSNIALPAGYDFANVHYLANYVKSIGGFDFQYSTQNLEEGTTTFTYMDYEKLPSSNGKQWVFHGVTLYDGELSSDQISIGKPSDVRNLNILPGKPGNVVITEVNKEEKSFQVYIEKINY